MRKIVIVFIYILMITIFIPLIITFSIKSDYSENEKSNNEKVEVVKSELIENIIVSNSNEQKEESIKLEEYIKGVVAAEMPVLFEKEALKAQAVAARTYTIKHIKENEDIRAENIGQAYITVEEMKNRWGEKFDAYYEKISSAVEDTKGQIIIFDNQPIEAVFHSTSRGTTESAENVWGRNLPYIKSVNSEGDKNAPDFEYTVSIPKSKVINIVKNKFKNIAASEENIFNVISILSKDDAGYVKEVSIAGNVISGVDFRKMFSLRSADFSIINSNDNIIFKTKGYGHGVGMSQYGAEFMAESGKTYEEILKHYYFNVEIVNIY